MAGQVSQRAYCVQCALTTRGVDVVRTPCVDMWDFCTHVFKLPSWAHVGAVGGVEKRQT